MTEQTDPVTQVLTAIQGMFHEDWRRLIDRLRAIDPDFFKAPTHPLTGETIVPNGVGGVHPPRHETGRLTD